MNPFYIVLRPFTGSDVPLFEEWLHTPHVAAWYPHPDEWLCEVRDENGEFKWIHHYIAEIDNRPVGFCQYYDCYDHRKSSVWEKVEDIDYSMEFTDVPNEKFSIDYLIGEPDYLRRGYDGAAMISALIEIIQLHGAKQVVACPEPENIASNRVLEHCGFVWDGKYYYVREFFQ